MREFWKRIELALNERIGLEKASTISLVLANNQDEAKRSAVRAQCMEELLPLIGRIYKAVSDNG